MGVEADQARQLRDVDNALKNLYRIGAEVEFKPPSQSTYSSREPIAVIRIKNAEETVERASGRTDENINVLWLVDIGNKAFEMYVELTREER